MNAICFGTVKYPLEVGVEKGKARTKNEIIRQETLIRRANLRALLCELEIDVTWKRIFAKAIEYIAKWPPSNFVYHFFLTLSLSPCRPFFRLSHILCSPFSFAPHIARGEKWNLFLFTQSSLMHDTYTIWNRLVMQIASRTQVYMMCVCVCSYPQKRWHIWSVCSKEKTRIVKIVHDAIWCEEKGRNKRKTRALFASTRNFIFTSALDIFFPAVFLFALRSFPFSNLIFSRWPVLTFPLLYRLVIHISNLFLLSVSSFSFSGFLIVGKMWIWCVKDDDGFLCVCVRNGGCPCVDNV